MTSDDGRSRWLLLGGTAAVAIGSLLPWAKVSAGFITVTKAGTEGDGIVTLLFALVVGAFVLWSWKAGLRRWMVITSLVLALLALAIAAYDTVDVGTTVSENEFVEVRATVGMGLWLALLGSIAMVIGAIWELRSPTRFETGTMPVTWGGPPTVSGHQPVAPPPGSNFPAPPQSPPQPPTAPGAF